MKVLNVFVAILLLLAFAPAYSLESQTYLGPSLSLSLLKYEPIPAEPGDYVDLWVTVSNPGSMPAEGVYVELEDTYPFFTISENDRKKFVKLIPAKQSTVLKFRVRVDKDAPERNAFIDAKARIGENNFWYRQKFPVEVRVNDAFLAIKNIAVDPNIMFPGKKARLSFDVVSLAESKVQDVSAVLNLGSNFFTVGSTNSKRIDEIKSGDASSFEYMIAASPDLDSGIYQVGLNLSYVDEQGNRKTQEENFGITVSSEPELIAVLDSSDIYKDSRKGKVNVRFVNKGLPNLKFVDVEILDSEDYKVLSPSKKYLGNIDSDDYESAEFNIEALKDSIQLEFLVTYTDSLNRAYEEKKVVPLNLISKEDAGIKESNHKYTWLAVVLLAIGLFWFFRKRKKNKQ